jgi:hypothetical protein
LRLINRVLAIVIGLVLIGVITIVAIVPEVPRGMLAGMEEVNLVLRLAVVVVLNVLVLIALYLVLRSPKKITNGLAVRAPGAYTDVSIESARKLILSAVESVPDVVSANAVVKAVNGKADVDLDVQVSGLNIHIPNKQKEINRALRQVIHKQLGLAMRGRPRVHIFLHGEKPPVPSAAPAVTEPAVQEKKALPEPEVRVASVPAAVPANDEDDTLLKGDQPASDQAARKDEKPGLFHNGLFGARHEPEKKEPAPREKSGDDWLNSFTTEQGEKDRGKSEGE